MFNFYIKKKYKIFINNWNKNLKINKKYSNHVLIWGLGDRGQLGLGKKNYFIFFLFFKKN